MIQVTQSVLLIQSFTCTVLDAPKIPQMTRHQGVRPKVQCAFSMDGARYKDTEKQNSVKVGFMPPYSASIPQSVSHDKLQYVCMHESQDLWTPSPTAGWVQAKRTRHITYS
jgi:hypothetical protein